MYFVSVTLFRKLIPEKLVIQCATKESAYNIYDCASFMGDFENVSYSTTKPKFNKRKYPVVKFITDADVDWKPTKFRIQYNFFKFPTQQEDKSYAEYISPSLVICKGN